MDTEKKLEKIQESIDEISEEKQDFPKILVLSPHRVEGSTALTKIVNNESPNVSKIINKNEYVLNLSKLMLLKSIKIETDDPSENLSKKLKVFYFDPISNQKHQCKNYFTSENKHILTINKVTQKILVQGITNGFITEKANISSINLIGYTPDSLSKIVKSAEYIEQKQESIEQELNDMVFKSQEELERLELEIEESKSEIKEKKQDLEKISFDIIKNTEKHDALSAKILNAQKIINDKDSEIKRRDALILELESDIEDRKNTVSTLSNQSSILKEEIARLQEDKSIFAIELKDYIGQGTSSKWQYFFLALIPLAVIASMAIMLFINASNFLEDLSTSRNTWELILSRTPYTLISFALITASYQICAYFIKQLTHINNERLNMTKLQIIAKDVTDTALDPEIDDPEKRQELRARLKMEVLKNYMRKEFTEDFNAMQEKEETKTSLQQRSPKTSESNDEEVEEDFEDEESNRGSA